MNTCPSHRQAPSGWQRLLAGAALAACLLLAALLTPSGARAHAFLKDSTPAANAILGIAPGEMTLRFTEPLETSYSRAELYDQAGEKVEGAAFSFGADGYSLVLALPPGLANGTYSALWRTLSTADGHTAQGYVPFTIGSERDVRTVVAPAPAAVSTGAPEVVRAASRWFALMALAAAVAIWPIWLFVLRPAIGPAWQAGPKLAARARLFAAWAVVVALLADVAALAVQAMSLAAGGGYLQALIATVRDTRYGTLWLVRVSLLAHAAAQPVGRATAVAFDWVHLLGACVWIGGVFVLLAVLVPSLNDLTPAGRQVVLGGALPRFSILALAAWAVMTATGLYQGWLQVGSLRGLTQTEYGQTLLVKFALLIPLLALGAFNLLVVTRKIRRATDQATETGWSGNFVTAIAAEALLVTLLLGVVGMLIGQPPAREVIAQEAGKVIVPLEADGQTGRLLLTPGATGPNHYRLELGEGHEAHLRNPASTEATLRFELPAQRTGLTEVRLAPALGGAFEGHGSELSIAGDWTIEAIVTQPGQPDWDVRTTLAVAVDPPPSTIPAEPPRFGAGGIAGLLLLCAGLAAVVWAAMRRASPARKEAAGLGLAAVGLGLLVLAQTRLPATLAAPQQAGAPARPDQALVMKGEPLFAANCLACHGLQGRGDGPQAGMNGIVPANLTVSHARLHSDEVIADWVRNGIAGTKMPGFANLSDDDIAAVVAYVRELQWDAWKTADAPGASECTVTPRTLADLRGLAASPAPGPAPDDSPPAAGSPPADADFQAIRAVVRQLVACSNAGDTMRRLALYSDARIVTAYPDGPTAALERIAGTPFPVLPEERVALLDISEVRQLADGRVAARVTIDNPQFHTHGPVTPAANQQQEAATLVFIRDGRGGWLIDSVSR
ncbi:MAG: CopD family protein [Chloroflexota bacterium]